MSSHLNKIIKNLHLNKIIKNPKYKTVFFFIIILAILLTFHSVLHIRLKIPQTSKKTGAQDSGLSDIYFCNSSLQTAVFSSSGGRLTVKVLLLVIAPISSSVLIIRYTVAGPIF